MTVYTCITQVRDSGYLTQHHATGPEEALREHIAALPFDDGTGPFNGELEWLVGTADGSEPVELLPVAHCQGAWRWRDGARHEPPYSTYIVRTEIGREADLSGSSSQETTWQS